MPNQRSKDQKGVLVMMDKQFREEIDKALPKAGYSDRSAFIRDAVYKTLQDLKIDIPPHLKAAPSRAGKGGRKPKVSVKIADKIGGQGHTVVQNNSFSSTSAAPARKGAKAQSGKQGKSEKR